MTVPSHGPDINRRMADMERRLAQIERHRGPVYPPMHRLADARLHDIKDGEGAVWDKATGYWVPGSAGGAGDMIVGHFTSTLNGVPAYGFGADVTGWASSPQFWPGFSVTTDHIVVETPGVYVVCGAARWEANATGARQVRIGGAGLGVSGLFPAPRDTRNAVSEEYMETVQSTEWAFGEFGAGDNQKRIGAAVYHTAAAPLQVQVDLYVMKLRGPT